MNCKIEINEKEKTIKFSFSLQWKRFARQKTEKFNHAIAKQEWKKSGLPFGLGSFISGISTDNKAQDTLDGIFLYELITTRDEELQNVRKEFLSCLLAHLPIKLEDPPALP